MVEIKPGLYRLKQIIGDPKQDLQPIIPVSRTAWEDGVRDGYYPPPTYLTPGTRCWKSDDLQDIVNNGVWSGASEEALILQKTPKKDKPNAQPSKTSR